CNCRLRDLTGNHLHPTSALNFQEQSELRSLNLKSNQIRSISAEYFRELRKLPNFSKLTLSDNKLSTIHKMAFNIFNLTSLSLENNYIADLKFLALMKTLISLNLKNNLISELKVEEFINLIHLENLTMSQNQVKTIHEAAFSKLQRLKFLDISFNPLTYLPNGIFDGLTSLFKLDLNNCHMKSFKNLFAKSLGGLEILSIKNNQIKAITNGLLKNLTSLRKLYLDGNKIELIEPQSFINTLQLSTLSLVGNFITKLNCNTLTHLKKLQILRLADMRIQYVVNQLVCLEIFELLDSLDISYSNMSIFIEIIGSRSLPNLKVLNIAGNQVEVIPYMMRTSLLENLRYLNISYNEIAMEKAEGALVASLASHAVSKTSAKGGHGIYTSNYYSFIDTEMRNFNVSIFICSDFSGLNWGVVPKFIKFFRNHLAEIYLDENNIQNFDISNLFKNSEEALETLSISHNKIKHVSNTRAIVLSKLQTLNLAYNLISTPCNGGFASIARSLKRLDLNTNQIDILPSACMEAYENLEFLDLTNNPLSIISSSPFAGAQSLLSIYSSQEYLCCTAPSTVTSCTPRRLDTGFTTCNALLAHLSLQLYVWIIGCVAFAGNIVAFIIQLREQKCKKNKVPSFLIANLAVADFLISIYLLIIAASDRSENGYFYQKAEAFFKSWRCLLACYICCSASLMSVFMMLLISIDRLICIVLPFSERKLNIKNAWYAIITFWTFSILWVGIPIYFSIGQNRYNRLHGDSSVCMASNMQNIYYKTWIGLYALLTFICWITVCVLHYLMYLSVRRSNRNVRKSSTTKDRKIALRLLLILITDLISWIPFYVICLRVWFDNKAIDIISLQFMTIFFLPINSAINPCLYTLSSPAVVVKLRSFARWSRTIVQIGSCRKLANGTPTFNLSRSKSKVKPKEPVHVQTIDSQDMQKNTGEHQDSEVNYAAVAQAEILLQP
ncbi:G-protein coupled receptor GRL101-like protein, partial [Trichoplax sp. H2]